LRGIARWVFDQSGERKTALLFISRLTLKIEKLAELPFVVGTVRPEIGMKVRSYTEGNYVILFWATPDVFNVKAVVEGHMDLRGFFD